MNKNKPSSLDINPASKKDALDYPSSNGLTLSQSSASNSHMFSGGVFKNCIFNFGNSPNESSPNIRRKRPLLIYSDSDSD